VGWARVGRTKRGINWIRNWSRNIRRLSIDPKLLRALKGRSSAYFHLKQYDEAIADYDRILALDPKDKASYNDRGLAKAQFGRTGEAVLDFTDAIQNDPRKLMEHYSYEGRAKAYMQISQWDSAIQDLTTAISLQLGGQLVLMNIGQFRALYPEYTKISDEADLLPLNAPGFG
jgi:tetratricopeptide (TPR) repeat protein